MTTISREKLSEIMLQSTYVSGGAVVSSELVVDETIQVSRWRWDDFEYDMHSRWRGNGWGIFRLDFFKDEAPAGSLVIT